MALPPGFLEELRVRTPLAPLIGRRVRIERSGRQWRACCPFHGEKTPSFYIYDDHYHCFGCGAHGDALTFIMETEGASFPEAVERLANEAGLEVPKATPQAAEADRRRHSLHSVLAQAAAQFHEWLFLPQGRPALDYLRGRGLSDDTIRRFGLGWSGSGRGTLTAALAREGVTPDLMAEAGLIRREEDGSRAREMFFERVMFPIRDRGGRVISFGGRTLGDGQPKYLNGPETPVFSKRRTLYALDLARAARAEIIVVEGYMDVIALHQAGFAGAVAPLGTALTDDHLAELWRLSPAPVLCFDADAAGRRAALRSAELALPLLAADRTLGFILLPDGEDPDSFIRHQGARGFRALLEAPRSMTDTLFDLCREAGDKTPEQRARLRARLAELAALVPDKGLAAEYRSALFDRFFAERPNGRSAKRAGPHGAAKRPIVPPRPPISSDDTRAIRARLLTGALLRHPMLLRDVEDAFRGLDLPADCTRLRKALLEWADQADALDSQHLMNHLTFSGLAPEAEQLLGMDAVRLSGFARADAMPEEAEAGWWHFFGLMNLPRLREELERATLAAAACMDDATQRRVTALRRAVDRIFATDTDEPA
jgi:DNA primase